MPSEFICTDCGAHVISITDDTTPYGALCALCLHMPGWFNDQQLVAIFDPDRAKASTTNYQPQGKTP